MQLGFNDHLQLATLQNLLLVHHIHKPLSWLIPFHLHNIHHHLRKIDWNYLYNL